MLLLSPIDYYQHLRNKYPNSYFAEDTLQVIIGIDCEYFDSYQWDYYNLQKIYNNQKSIAPFAGLFGVLAFESIHFFEEIPPIQNQQYSFPQFIFANAQAYLHYDKISKVYSFYGDRLRYYNFLEQQSAFVSAANKKFYYSIANDLEKQQQHFYALVEKAKQYIRKGDVFQVVLSEPLQIKSNLDSFYFYNELKKANPSPYMFHFPTPYGDVTGSSPEILVEVKNNQIFIAPIAGTRPRGKTPAQDQQLSQDLLNDEKELAEHRMLVDLARNDIGKVSQDCSVQVKNLFHIQHYQHVMHIGSEVYGKKKNEASLFDVIASAFPAGTLSGAPKIRALEIINELETYKRNFYGGGLGFLHFNGDLQLAILIRSAFFKKEEEDFNIFIQSGAGIVYDSVKEKEYQEIIHKRASLLKVFENLCENNSEES